MRSCSALLLLCVGILVRAQIPERDLALFQNSPEGLTGLELAMHHYQHSHYQKAGNEYLKALDLHELSAEDFLYMANSLMAQAKSSLAKEFFKEYLRLSGQEFGAISDMVSAVFRVDSNSFPHTRFLNGSEKHYGPQLFDGKLTASSEGVIVQHVYNCGELSPSQELLSSYTYIRPSSWTSFDAGFKAVVGKTDTKGGTTALYQLTRNSKGDHEVNMLKFCKKGFSYCHPYFDASTNILYFSSDQSGGSGGYDLYMSYFVNGKFEDPINLGGEVNTAMDELYPTIIDQWLYFSSNGYPSKGGFDIYKFRRLDDYDRLLVNVRRLNSAEDEFGIARSGHEQFIIGRYSDSLSYLVELSMPQPLMQYSGIIMNQDKEIIKDAYVIIGNNHQGYFTRSINGQVDFQLPLGEDQISISVFAEGYELNKQLVKAGHSFRIQLQAVEPVEIVKVIDRSGSDSSTVVYSLDSMVHENERPARQLHDGVTKPKAGVFYVIVASSRNYEDAYRAWSEWNTKLSSLQIIQFNEGLYRIGFEAGSDELSALNSLRRTLEVQQDAWIIRPGTI